MRRIFLDHAAGRENPNSIHEEGRRARAILDSAKHTIATYIGADSPDQIIFFPSASLTNYFLLEQFNHVTSSAIEHHSILHHPHTKTLLSVDDVGRVKTADLCTSEFLPADHLISIALANHEIGTIQDIKNLAKVAHDQGMLLHTDASAAFTKVPINVKKLGVDYLTLSGPKIGTPGIAALYVRTPTPNLYKFPLGTPNIPAISRLNKLLEQGSDFPNLYKFQVRPLRDHLRARILAEIPHVTINGNPQHSLPNLLNISIKGAEGESLLCLLDLAGIAVSTGSACALGAPSHVILALHHDPIAAHNSLRLSLNPDNTKAEVDHVVDQLKIIVKKLRSYTTCQ